ncbi:MULTISPECIES: metal resistance protein [Proteus]|uniref:metal resistance protein n=1 Tax=Proteus TaxID=583 RepID=UPI000D68BEF7|nr:MULTISPECIES: metal resistance protein [Proteus]MCX2586608.1 metal resistance protein [Proteus penneri]NBL77906.1 metal resistance protein [Proteus sp. G2672]
MSNWRSGRWLVVITVLLILSCIVQRSLGAHVISERLAMAVAQTQYPLSTPITDEKSATDHTYSLSTCELSAKSLISVPPLTIEPFFHSWAVLLLLSMAGIYVSRQRNQKKHHHPPPPIRLHLHYCILRD